MANTATASVGSWTGGRFLSSRYSESSEPNLIRSDMEGGTSKQAPRSSKIRVSREVTYLFSDTELSNFKTWHKDTVKSGSLFFVYTDPITNDIADWRIAGGRYTVAPVNARANYFYVNFEMETYV